MCEPIRPGLRPREVLQRMSRALAEGGIDTNRSDARFLVQHLLGLTASDLTLDRGAPVDDQQAAQLAAALRRRLTREPVARVIGAWEFWGLTFQLSPATLVPRPDTETVVEAALSVIADRNRCLRILDLGTGSGCILTALLAELPHAWGLGLDRTRDAAHAARANTTANGVGERARFVVADWAAPLAGAFDLIVSNPPYIATATIAGLDLEVREHDPTLALDGGCDGLDAYRRILSQVLDVPGLVASGGTVILEIGYDQAAAVAALGTDLGCPPVAVRQDLAGHDRVVILQPLSDGTPPTTKAGR